MSRKSRRYALKSSETKNLLSHISKRMRINIDRFIDPKANFEAIEIGDIEVIIVDKKPLFFKDKGVLFPTLVFQEVLTRLPKAIVDMGAIRFVCNGADVMAPGIVRFEGDFSKGDIVVVVDVKHGKPLALGEIQFDSESVKKAEKGAVIKNMHYVSDEIWETIKSLG